LRRKGEVKLLEGQTRHGDARQKGKEMKKEEGLLLRDRKKFDIWKI